MILFLSILVVLLAGLLVFFIYTLLDITQQLSYIVNHDTNAELVSTSKNFLVRRLLNLNNQLIQKNKKIHQKHWNNEKEFNHSLSNLSHDLKTPLTVSSGYVQLLLKEQTDPKTHELLKKTEVGLSTIENYLSYLMEYTLIHEKKLQMHFELVNITQLIQEEAFVYYEDFLAKNIELSFDLEDDLSLISDSTVIKRIIQNVLGNILKHGQTQAYFTGRKESNRILLTIKNDTDQPIDTDQNLLNRFVTNDRSRQNKSTGLGLNIIKELTELLDGDIQLTTEPSSFQLSLSLPIRSDTLKKSSPDV